MDFSLSPQDQAMVDRAKELAKEFATRAKEYDDEASFPAKDFERLREEGFLTLTVPEELGGHGMWSGQRFLPMYMILEALASGNASTAQLVQIQSHASGIIAFLGNEEQKRRYLGEVVSRGALIASCGSETDPRQAASSTGRAELVQVEGGFRLNSTKFFASLSPAADYYVVYVMAPGAKTMEEGYTTLVVSKDDPGVSLENSWDVMGMRATISWSLILKDVFIPWENVLGQPGDWVQHDPRTFTLAYCANHLGTAQGVFDFLLDYLKQRPFLLNDDVNAYTVGEMDSALQATRTSMWYSAWLWEQGRYEEAEMASMRVLAHLQADGVDGHHQGLRRLRCPRRLPLHATGAGVPRRAHLLAPLPRIGRAAHAGRRRSRQAVPLQAEVRTEDRATVVGGSRGSQG